MKRGFLCSFLLFWLVLLYIPITKASVIDDWFAEGSTLTLGSKEFIISGSEDGTIVLLKSAENIIVVEVSGSKIYTNFLINIVDAKPYLKSHPDVEAVGIVERDAILYKYLINVDMYDAKVELKKSIDSAALMISDAVNVVVWITNTEDMPLKDVIYEDEFSPFFAKKGQLQIESDFKTTKWEGETFDNKVYWKGDIGVNESVKLIYSLTVAGKEHGSDKLILFPSYLKFYNGGYYTSLATEQFEITINVPLEIAINGTGSNVLSLDTPKTFKVSLKNTDLVEKIHVKNLTISIPDNIQIYGTPHEFAKKEQALEWSGSINQRETKELYFDLISPFVLDDELKAGIEYAFYDSVVKDNYSAPVSVSLKKMTPIIDISKAEFASGENASFGFHLLNPGRFEFRNINGYVDIGFERHNFSIGETEDSEKITLLQLDRNLPVAAEDARMNVFFEGTYETKAGMKFDFSENKQYIVSKQADYELPFNVEHMPVGYIDGASMRIITGIQNLTVSLDLVEIKTVTNSGEKATSFSKTDVFKFLKGKKLLAHEINYSLVDENGKNVDNVDIITYIKYEKDGVLYFYESGMHGAVKDYKEMIESAKLTKNLTQLTESFGEEEMAAVTAKKGFSLKTILAIFIVFIIGVLLFVVINGYINKKVLKERIRAAKGEAPIKGKVMLYSAPKLSTNYDELERYIMESRQNGAKNAEIKRNLLKQGWNEDIIDEFLR